MQVSKGRRSSSGSTKLDYCNNVGLQVGSKHLISHIVKAYLGKDFSYLSCLSLESLRLSRKVGCVRTNDSFRMTTTVIKANLRLGMKCKDYI